MGIEKKGHANFSPSVEIPAKVDSFRFWCQKVLPLVYDDSLSYYELLCKVVDYLNNTIADVNTLGTDVDNINKAYNELQSYVNDYFSTLDVQNEINNKLDEMSKNGSLTNIIAPLVNSMGTPLIVDNISDMTNVSKIYILKTDGNIYYYNGTEFVNSNLIYGADTISDLVNQNINTIVSNNFNDGNISTPDTVFLITNKYVSENNIIACKCFDEHINTFYLLIKYDYNTYKIIDKVTSNNAYFKVSEKGHYYIGSKNITYKQGGNTPLVELTKKNPSINDIVTSIVTPNAYYYFNAEIKTIADNNELLNIINNDNYNLINNMVVNLYNHTIDTINKTSNISVIPTEIIGKNIIECTNTDNASPIDFYLLEKTSKNKYIVIDKKNGSNIIFKTIKNKTYKIGFYSCMYENGNTLYEEIQGINLNIGDTAISTTYTNIKFDYNINIKYIPISDTSSTLNTNGTINVGKNETFKTINSAVDYIKQNMNGTGTIILYPNVYNEVVNIGGKNNISIIGIDKEKCIIRDDTGIYDNAPLRVSNGGYFANLTIISTHDKTPNFVIDNILQYNPSYAVHIDDRHNDDDNKYNITFYNCKFISQQNPAIGIGLDKNLTITLDNCEIITNQTDDIINTTSTTSGIWGFKQNGGALFYHALYPNTSGYTNPKGYQILKVKNCIIKSNNNNFMFGERGSSYDNDVTLELNYNSGYSEKTQNTWNNELKCNIRPISYGNNFNLNN